MKKIFFTSLTLFLLILKTKAPKNTSENHLPFSDDEEFFSFHSTNNSEQEEKFSTTSISVQCRRKKTNSDFFANAEEKIEKLFQFCRSEIHFPDIFLNNKKLTFSRENNFFIAEILRDILAKKELENNSEDEIRTNQTDSEKYVIEIFSNTNPITKQMLENKFSNCFSNQNLIETLCLNQAKKDLQKFQVQNFFEFQHLTNLSKLLSDYKNFQDILEEYYSLFLEIHEKLKQFSEAQFRSDEEDDQTPKLKNVHYINQKEIDKKKQIQEFLDSIFPIEDFLQTNELPESNQSDESTETSNTKCSTQKNIPTKNFATKKIAEKNLLALKKSYCNFYALYFYPKQNFMTIKKQYLSKIFCGIIGIIALVLIIIYSLKK